MATKNSDYNYQQDIENVLNAKIGWNNATTDEERKKQNEIATAARDRLKAYGYGHIADQISASGADATATRKILEQYSPPKTATYPIETNNLKSNEVNRENAGSFEKHNKAYDYIMNTDPFKTSEGKAILGKYDLAGLQARDNAVASGGAANGGNIDSYASANAMRQQAGLIRQGQGAVLDAHQQKIDNVRGILSDIGVNIDRVFNQDETSKNNNVARLSEQANVTGYTPNEWIIKNDDIYNQFLNEDGTFKKEQEGVDIQALINQAKASGDTETAKKLAVVRTRKILGNYGEFGKYSNIGDISSMTPQQTEAGRVADMNNATVLKSLETESADKRYEIDTTKEIAEKEMQVALQEIQAKANEGDYAAGELNGFLATWNASDSGPRTFITNVLWKDYINNGVTPSPEELINLIVENTKKHNIDVEDAKRICDFFRVSKDWLKDFVDCTSDDDYYDDKGNLVKGDYLGMKKKQ